MAEDVRHLHLIQNGRKSRRKRTTTDDVFTVLRKRLKEKIDYRKMDINVELVNNLTKYMKDNGGWCGH